MTPASNPTTPIPYARGEISRRLDQLAQSNAAASSPASLLDPYRQAASVLVAFNPANLKPVGFKGNAAASPYALVPELVPSPYADSEAGLPWTLPVSSRKTILRQLGTRKALKNALKANAAPAMLLQKTLAEAINGRTFDIATLTMEELTALSSVSDWLENTEPGRSLPSPGSLRQVIEARWDQETLKKLAGNVFTGRELEMAQVQGFLNATDPRILFVSGTGGTGKSALISQVLLLWSQTPGTAPGPQPGLDCMWIRVDLDYSLVEPDKPVTLLQAAATQLKRRYPDFDSILDDFISKAAKTEGRRDYQQLESVFVADLPDDLIISEFISMVGSIAGQPDQRIAFWIDTFEEAQFLGDGVVLKLLTLVQRLAQSLPNVRVVLSGRAPLRYIPPEITTVVESLPLEDLPPEAAGALLVKLVGQINSSSTNLPDHLTKKAIRLLGGNPLTLRLAAPLLAQDGKQSLPQLRGIKHEALQRRLFSRILEHIHNPELRKLAVPGLIVRRITPAVIQEVLAKPCRLGPIDAGDAQELLDEFAKEITLVERDADGSLRHRQDVRLVMLAGMPRELKNVIRQIDEQAVEYWRQRPDPAGRAEEIYHRLRLKQSRSELAARWLPESGRFLANALEELPKKSAQRLWLAGMLHVVLDTAESAGSSQAAWEQQVAVEAQRFLVDGKPQEALKVLRARSERLPGSLLYGLESRACLFLNKINEAISVARNGISAAQNESSGVAVDLALLLEFIYESQNEFGLAAGAATQAATQAAVLNDPMLQLAAGLRKLRLGRLSNVPADPKITSEVLKLAHVIGPNFLASRPGILREAGAELGDYDVEILRWTSNALLDEIFLPMSNDQLVGLLVDLRLVPETEAARLKNAHPEELRKLARHHLEERLYSDGQESSEVRMRLQLLFQQNVEATLHRESGMRISPASQLAPHGQRFSLAELDSDLRARVESIVSATPEETLRKIARFQLRTDFESLSQRGPESSVAKELVDRALRLERLPQVLTDLVESEGTNPSLAAEINVVRDEVMSSQRDVRADSEPSGPANQAAAV